MMDYLMLIPINIKHRSLRSWLTLLGIIVGVIAIVVMISLGDGLKHTVTKQLEEFGPQNIIILPGSLKSMIGMGAQYRPQQGKLYESDVDRIQRIPGIVFTSRMLIVPRCKIRYKGEEIYMAPAGMESNLFTSGIMPQYSPAKGRIFKDNEKNVVLIGHDFAYNVFDKPINVNSYIYINDKKYRVVGIMKKIGGMSGSSGDDQMIAIPYSTARDIVDDLGLMGKNEISAVYVRVADGFDPEDVADRIEFELRSAHKVKEDDFTVMTSEYIMEQINTILGVITIFLGTIAGISLLVSAVGVSNTMFTAVLERTKEIGIIKALGAKNHQILMLFLTESAMLCGLGGLIGLVLSFLLIYGFNYVSVMFNLGVEAIMTPWLAVGAFIFSLLIGVVAGISPAWKASKFNPVDALRYE